MHKHFMTISPTDESSVGIPGDEYYTISHITVSDFSHLSL
jgi:hypothetical protein